MATLTRLLVFASVLIGMFAGAAQAGQAGMSTIPLGLYSCYSTNPAMVGGLTYHGSFLLKANGGYAFSYSLRGRTLGKPRLGSFTRSGSKITFSGAPLGSFYGVQKGADKFAMHIKGKPTPFTWCYLKR
jgi:hypothetical protein